MHTALLAGDAGCTDDMCQQHHVEYKAMPHVTIYCISGTPSKSTYDYAASLAFGVTSCMLAISVQIDYTHRRHSTTVKLTWIKRQNNEGSMHWMLLCAPEEQRAPAVCSPVVFAPAAS